MFRGGPNLLFVSGESEDDSDSDIPHLVADSEDEVIVDELQICFDALPKRETFRNQCEEYLACLGSPEESRESGPNVGEEVSAFAQPKAGSVHRYAYGTKKWQPCDWPDVCLRKSGVIGSPVDRWLFVQLNL